MGGSYHVALRLDERGRRPYARGTEMKIVVAGGTGQVGTLLRRRAEARGDHVVVLSRRPSASEVAWDGRIQGDWSREIDGADVVVNLAGRSVNCRYTKKNLADMMSSRVDSTRAIGLAIEAAKSPPKAWLQMSTATIYAHRLDAANDEATGILGGNEPGVPAYWGFSVEIAKAWERAQAEAFAPHTRKVQLRAAMVMSPDRGGIFDVMAKMARAGFGGSVGGGAQYVSWIHETDFCDAIDFLITKSDIDGPVNLAAPEPLPYKAFMADLRAAVGAPFGLPATRWMAEIGAFFLRTDTELLLKSRRVIPTRLRDAGFEFRFTTWAEASRELATRWR
jgi:uncharacterized protein (TIGR01777 family)